MNILTSKIYFCKHNWNQKIYTIYTVKMKLGCFIEYVVRLSV